MEIELNSIYKFSKSYIERYQEYYSILNGNTSGILSIRERWSHYLEVGMDRSSHGWYAYWNILRASCDRLNITFPKVVHVQVIDVNYEELSANVSIINAQNDEELVFIPSVIESVPLKDLYAITSEEFVDLDLIADYLDQLRFFYHHLWWPWVDDAEDINNKSVDWVSDHLEYRLQLYYDKLAAKMPYTSAKKIKRLMEKCRESYELLRINDDVQSSPEVFRAYNELNSMKVELNQWSVPEMRRLKNEEVEKANSERGVFVALQENEMQNVEMYLRQVQDLLTQEKLDNISVKIISSSFEECHLNYDKNDIIMLTPGKYELNYMEYFDFPVSIRGLKRSDLLPKTIISEMRSFWSIFQSLTTTVLIENVDFELNFSAAVFIMKRGTLVLNDVHFNNLSSQDAIAIRLHKKTEVIARRCRFSNFNTAIICQAGAILQLVDCTFQNNSSCVQFVEGTKITMNNCDLTNTTNIPFIYERYSNEIEETSCESLDYLSKISGVTINQVQLDDEMVAVEIS